MSTVSDRIISFNHSLHPELRLPAGIRMMNPFREFPDALEASELFYRKYYSDNCNRKLILGINPGRFGAGVTGVPFTDPKRLTECCRIPWRGAMLHEPSSVFVYDMIEAYGGTVDFYGDCYINSLCPLGFTSTDDRGREKNYNYYDSRELLEAVLSLLDWNIRRQIDISGTGDKCYCLGTGTNYKMLTKLNMQHAYFKTIIPLEHPRFIVQYRHKDRAKYIGEYLRKLKE